jgi:hypothetical protein
MQLCDIELRLGGQLTSTVHKQDVTPAEIQVLWAIHGEDAVTNVRPRKMDKRTHKAEYDRLVGLYGRAPDGLMDAGNGALLEKIYPGAQKVLPVSLGDIGREAWMRPNTATEDTDGESSDTEEASTEESANTEA